MLDDFIKITKALSDKNRIRLFFALRKKELCLCQLTEFLKLAPSTVSKHMSVLKQAGLVKCRKEERWMYYSHADAVGNKLFKNTFKWVSASIGESAEIKQDEKLIKKVLFCSFGDVCIKQITK